MYMTNGMQSTASFGSFPIAGRRGAPACIGCRPRQMRKMFQISCQSVSGSTRASQVDGLTKRTGAMMKTTMLWKEVSVCPYNARRTGRMQRANKAQHPGRANKSKHVRPEANLIVTRPCLKLNVPKRKYLKHHEVHDAEDAEDEPPDMWRVMSAGVDGGVFEDVRGKEPTQGEEGDESVHPKASKVNKVVR